MPCVDQKCQHERLNRIKTSEQQVDGDKFDRAGENCHAHQRGINPTEARRVHVDAVSQSEEPKARKNRHGERKRRF